MNNNKQIFVRLVQSVEKYPCLYNTQLPEYAKREHTERAWIEVAEELFSTPDLVKEKWKNCRSVFARRLKQMHMGELIKPYYLHEHLQYLTPYLQNRWDPEFRTKHLLEESEGLVASYNHTAKSENSFDIENTSDGLCNDVGENMNSTFLNEPRSQHQHTKRKRLASTASEEEDFHDLYGYPSRKLATPVKRRQIRDATYFKKSPPDYTLSDNENAKRLFMLSLLPDLEEMNNKQMREFKTKAITLINEIFKGNVT